MLHKSISIVAILASASAWAQTTCPFVEAERVLVYDARAKQAYFAPSGAVNSPVLGNAIPALPTLGWYRDRECFFVDGRAPRLYVVNRKLKEVFTSAISSVFTLPSGVIDLRGVPPPTTPAPPAPPAPAAAAGATHGAGTAMTVDDVFAKLLNEKGFPTVEASLDAERDALRASARLLDVQVAQFRESVRRLIGAPAAAAPAVQGSATLVRTSAAFDAVLASTASTLANPADPEIERNFDLLVFRINALTADLQRLGSGVAAGSYASTLSSLETQAETQEANVRAYYADLDTVQAAVEILDRLLRNTAGSGLVDDLTKATMRADIRGRYPTTSTPNLTDANVQDIVDKYTAAGNMYRLQLMVRVPDLARKLVLYRSLAVNEPALQRGHALDQFREADALTGALRQAIRNTNESAAAALGAIDQAYNTIRIPTPVQVDLSLGGVSGNLVVTYTITGAQSFTPFLMQNEIPQPVPASSPATPPAAPSGNGSATAPASLPGSAGAGSAGVQTPPAVASASPSPAAAPAAAPTPPPEYVGQFQVHHFTHGTAVVGFVFDSVRNRSYSLASPSQPGSTPADVIVQSTPTGTAVAVGLDVYFKPADMFPHRRSYADRFLPTGVMVAASVNPLNQYFIGPAAEPWRGVTYSFGWALAQQARLTDGLYPGILVPFTSSGGTSATYTAPTLASASGFRNGAFVMVGFDLNIFQTVFGKWFGGGVTSLGSTGPTTSTTSGQ